MSTEPSWGSTAWSRSGFPAVCSHDVVEVDGFADKSERLAAREPAESYDRGVGSTLTGGEEVGDPGIVVRGGVASGEHEGDRRLQPLSALEVAEQLQRRVGRPVDVVDDHRQRTTPRASVSHSAIAS